jgi:hypothetical protein
MDNKPQFEDENGNMVDAEPIGLMCEHHGCMDPPVGEFVRIDTDLPNGWGSFPEMLCATHSDNRELLRLIKGPQT